MFTDIQSVGREFSLYVRNNEELYNKAQWCANAMIKRYKRGEVMEKSYLVSCSIVSQITTAALRMYMKEFGSFKVSKPMRAAIKEEIADYIWDLFNDSKNQQLVKEQ